MNSLRKMLTLKPEDKRCSELGASRFYLRIKRTMATAKLVTRGLYNLPSGFSLAADSIDMQCEEIAQVPKVATIDGGHSQGVDPSNPSGESIDGDDVDLSVFDRALASGEKVVLSRPKSNVSAVSENTEHPKEESYTESKLSDDSKFTLSFSDWEKSSQSHQDSDSSQECKSVYLLDNKGIHLTPGVEAVYVSTNLGCVTITLSSNCEDGAEVTIKDISSRRSSDARVTVSGETKIEHYNRHHEIALDRDGSYILNSLRGSVTFLYSKKLDAWCIKSQVVGSSRDRKKH